MTYFGGIQILDAIVLPIPYTMKVLAISSCINLKMATKINGTLPLTNSIVVKVYP